LFGWDCDGDTPYVLGDPDHSHGSMCAGIIAGRVAGDPPHLTGVAPRAQLMVLRGMGRLAAYEYAAERDAHVLSLSYMWVNVDLGSYRGVFRTAHEHLAACGVLAVGGAGNFRKTAPAGRQIALPKDIPCVTAVAGIDKELAQTPFSSEGPCSWVGVPFFDDYPETAPLPKPDLCAPALDFPVWHWVEGRRGNARALWQGEDGFGLVLGPRGNSFAGPHAAGVAALVLGVNPELTPWRVQAILAATAKDLGAPGHDLAHGAGLLRAAAAVAAARAAKVGE
jgi:subtilisin family serine protease